MHQHVFDWYTELTIFRRCFINIQAKEFLSDFVSKRAFNNNLVEDFKVDINLVSYAVLYDVLLYEELN